MNNQISLYTAKKKNKQNTVLEIGSVGIIGAATAAAGVFALPAVAAVSISAGSAALIQSVPKLIDFFNNNGTSAELPEDVKDEILRECVNYVLDEQGVNHSYYYSNCKSIVQGYSLDIEQILKNHSLIENIPEELYTTWADKGTTYVPYPEEDRMRMILCLRSYIASLVLLEINKSNVLVSMLDSINRNSAQLEDYEKDLLALKSKIEQYDPDVHVIITPEKLWEASRQQFVQAREEGGRFYRTKGIIQELLPQGLLSDQHLQVIGKNEEEQAAPIQELYKNEAGHLAIVGEGGIGKTTFLQQLLTEQFNNSFGETKNYTDDTQIFFFVELNRCPDSVESWYDDTLRKTNFITRYIGQAVENHQSMDTVSPVVLDQIEKEFQRIPSDSVRKYVLLLDGFNEVRTTNSVREYLSQEIMHLQEYKNVRIITTSRETQSAFFTYAFRTIQVIGLKKNQINDYLEACQIKQPVIGTVMNTPVLLQCLRIPLYVCMFTSVATNKSAIPETAGEILHAFFYGESTFYNAKNRIKAIETASFSDEQMSVILNFILPYIGWYFEEKERFSFDRTQMEMILEKAFSSIKSTVLLPVQNVYPEFQNTASKLEQVMQEFFDAQQKLKTDDILCFLTDYLGIMYRYSMGIKGGISYSYAFCHHHFRDFYSAMWDVQLLRMLICLDPGLFSQHDFENADSFEGVLNSQYWSTEKVHFISQILKEHRNRSKYDQAEKRWVLPEMDPAVWERMVLTDALDFCRKLFERHIDTKHILRNILSAIWEGRHDLAGLELNNLDLTHCNFFNITCSKPGMPYPLSTDFRNSVFGETCFEPENHKDPVIEFVYHDTCCFTIDRDGLIKCWDLRSGILEYELYAGIPESNSEMTSNGFLKISSDGRWLGTMVQMSTQDGYDLYVAIFDLQDPSKALVKLKPDCGHKVLNYFAFTEDAKGLLVLLDKKYVYCFDIETGNRCYRQEFDLLHRSEIYAESVSSEVFAFSADYNPYIEPYYLEDDMEEDWDEYEDSGEECKAQKKDANGFDDESWDSDEEFDDSVPCELLRLNPMDGTSSVLYSFSGEPGVSPCAVYNPMNHSFLLYNYETRHFEVYDCRRKLSYAVLNDLTDLDDTTPGAIHVHPEKMDECYVMYSDCIFQAKYLSRYKGCVLTKYSIEGVERLIPNSDGEGELRFEFYTVPKHNRFIVRNDRNVYEWNTVKETITLKYNTAFYDVKDFLPTNQKRGCMMVHEMNGISLFTGSPPKLAWQYCFDEPDYFIGQVCHAEEDGLLAIAFARPDHEKVELFDVNTGCRKPIYSTIHKGETIETLSFSSDRRNLLITSQAHAFEYNLDEDTLYTVKDAEENERIVGGDYKGPLIEVDTVQHSLLEAPQIEPKGLLYEKGKMDHEERYQLYGYYILPELTKEQRPFFVVGDYDFGIKGPVNDHNLQAYWVTRGFLLEDLTEMESVQHPKFYRCVNGNMIQASMKIGPREMISVRHSFALRDPYLGSIHGPCYMYLSDDMKEAVFSQENIRLAYCKDLPLLTYKKLENEFQRKIGNESSGSYWNSAVPDQNGNLIGAYEHYMLMGISTETGKVTEEITYSPGICVNDCDFTGAIMPAEVKEMLKANGAVMYE